MSISFIVTTFDIRPYILECLQSLRPCLRPGDQVILVDDGSTDGTDEVVRDFIRHEGFGPDVEWTPVWLGVNTIGGVGIPANIGMDHADRDTVFFVDGDDYMIPDAFLKARRAYEAAPADICFADYLEYDQQAGQTRPPADARKWAELETLTGAEAVRLAAIGLIAVPWRKFYRAEFLRRHRIRFPEGDFFFEDNPFHWTVCTLAGTIGFQRHVICHHRVNRPGQTMASTGTELAAFFTHFETIRTGLPPTRDDLRLQAAHWLLGNMSWHIPRLRPAAFHLYAGRAKQALQQIGDGEWQTLDAGMNTTTVWHYADRLRQGDTWGVIEAWRSDADRATLSGLRREIGNLANRLREVERQARTAREILQAQQAIDEFAVVKETLGLSQQNYLVENKGVPAENEGFYVK